MASITFYGGARELGGNQFLISDRCTNVMLDFGINFDRWGKLYLFPQGPPKYRALRDLTKLGLCPDFSAVPDFDGVYRQDYLRHIGREPTSRPTLDAFVLSHAHLDHAYFLHFLRHDIPVYMDKHTKRILFSMQQTTGMQYSEYVDFKYAYGQTESTSSDKKRWMQGDEVTVSRDTRLIEPPKPFTIGSITFEPIYVDHSMPGTCAFIIHTSKGKIVYSADLRMRGRRPQETENFVRIAAKASPDYLLCEGSLIWKTHYGTEDDVGEDIQSVIEDKDGLVVISYAPRDLDRVLTLFNVAKKSKRKLVISTKQAYLLDLFNGDFGFPRTHLKNIGVYVPKKGKGLLDTGQDGEEGDYYRWERQYVDHDNRVSSAELNKNPRDYILCLSGAILDDLIEIEPPKGSIYIRAHPEPYTEEMELGENVLESWLRRFNLLDDEDKNLAFYASRGKGRQLDLFRPDPEPTEKYNVPQRHVTGHMSMEETAYVINSINPRTLVPIHTINPEMFHDMGFNGRIWTPRLGDVLEL
ncbi:MAG TPA: MBL fold metallo-hydrolase [archaeon]|nr:MBL fold metallo-hydrolase [archaeon]